LYPLPSQGREQGPGAGAMGNEVIAGIVADPGFTATLTKLIDSW
jgi:hypothetical protein